MKINKGYIAVGLIIALSVFFGLTAHADEYDESSTLTFSQPIQIPGMVLPAGSYVFRLADSAADRYMVQIFNADRTVLYATVQTVPTLRQNATGDTAVALAEPGAKEPDVLLKWFYPGRETGSQFVYPPQERKELAQDRHQSIVAGEPAVSSTDATGAGD